MERLTHERVNGIKTGYWSAATKEVLVQKLAAYENTGYEPDEIRAAIEQAAKNSETNRLTSPETAGSSPCRCVITSRSLRRTTGSSPPALSVALSAGRQTRPAGSSHWSPTSEPPAQPAR